MTDHTFIVDTNVVVAGLIAAEVGSPTVKVLDSMLGGRLFFLLSPELLGEYREVLLRPTISRLHGLDESEIDQILAELTANAIWKEPQPDADRSAPDPNDSHLWALLASDRSAIPITGDRLLIEKPKPKRTIISPATWVTYFVSPSPPCPPYSH